MLRYATPALRVHENAGGILSVYVAYISAKQKQIVVCLLSV